MIVRFVSFNITFFLYFKSAFMYKYQEMRYDYEWFLIVVTPIYFFLFRKFNILMTSHFRFITNCKFFHSLRRHKLLTKEKNKEKKKQ